MKKIKLKKKMYRILFIVAVFIGILVLGLCFCVPKITLNNKDVYIKVGENYSFNEYDSKLLFINLKDKVVLDSNYDKDKVGKYDVVYKVKFGFLKAEEKQYINVIDDELPVITLEDNEEKIVCSVKSYEEAGYNALDNYDGDITDKVSIEYGDSYIDYKAVDSSGNTSTVRRNLKVEDNEKPKLSLNGKVSDTIILNGEYIEDGATASDNCLGDISDRIKIEGSVDTHTTGNYKIKYSVTDDNGNETTLYRNITVSDTIDEGIIYLTFDDGPGAYTSKILDILDKYNIKATFFVTNSGSDSLIQREYESGHTVGLHTATHKWEIYKSVDSYFADLNIVRDRVKRITGQDTKYIRFPGGSSNTVSKSYAKGIMSTLSTEVIDRGYQYFDWNVSVEDAGSCAYVTDKGSCVVKYFKNGLSKNRINIVLMHDIKSYTADNLETMIKYAINAGYGFRAIDENTLPVHFKVAN